MENQKIYYKALASCMQNAYVFFFTLGIYFVYIPWNLERLDLVETDLGLWLFIFGIVNLITNQFTGRIIVPKIGTNYFSQRIGLFSNTLLFVLGFYFMLKIKNK